MEDKNVLKSSIAEQKLTAFAIGNMGKRNLSKRELEELRKKEADEATAHAFQDFIHTFQNTSTSTSKVWIKAGTYDAGARKEDVKEKGKVYKPQPKIVSSDNQSSAEKAQEYARLLANDSKPERLGKKKEKDKKKSVLESFKEELRQIQEEREERHKCKTLIKTTIDHDLDIKSDMGSFDNGDPNTTNLYLGNLNPKITENQLKEIFGKYGPLASIKIMWPRSDEEKARGRNCGFVAFMSRKDGERALRNLNGKDIMMYEMKLGWGKCVPIPQCPIYVPPSLSDLSMPPPASHLPFNAQPIDPEALKNLDTNDLQQLDNVLAESVVKVVIPTDRNILALIHRTIEFVIREGPLFEAIIMNREISNPMFRFLFENQGSPHIYYRWKLFSMMQGDTQREWRTQEFRMFKGGSIWKPPIMNIYTQGMPEELIVEDGDKEPNKGALSVAQRDRLEELLRYISPERLKIAETMVFCIEHRDAADEICECILESLSNVSTAIHKKIARLYLISDILHNCGVKINNASSYRRAIEVRLVSIMRNLHEAYNALESRLKAEGFKMRVVQVFSAWEEWLIYPREFLLKLRSIFLGVEQNDECNTRETNDSDKFDKGTPGSTDGDSDGVPLDDDPEEIDNVVPFDGAALLKGALKHNLVSTTTGLKREINIDGQPLSPEDPDGMPLTPPPPSIYDADKKSNSANTSFVPSRWETVDPEQLEAQAMTTSKWDQLEALSSHPNSQLEGEEESDSSSGSQPSNSNKSSNIDLNDAKMSEDRRRKLREVEVKTMQYQDELEAGHRTLKSGWTMAQQVEHYRRKLIRKVDKKMLPEREAKEKSERDTQNSQDSKHSCGSRKSRSEKSSRRSRSPATEDIDTFSRSSRKYKRRSRSSSRSISPARVRHRSRSRSPLVRKSKHSRSQEDTAPSPPSPPRIVPKHCTSPPTRYRRSVSPAGSGSRYTLASPSPPPRSRHKRRGSSPRSPPRPKYPSLSPPPRKHRNRSPHESAKKHRHRF